MSWEGGDEDADSLFDRLPFLWDTWAFVVNAKYVSAVIASVVRPSREGLLKINDRPALQGFQPPSLWCLSCHECGEWKRE